VNAAICAFCGRPVDPNGYSVYRKITGWERKAHAESRRGGSDIVLREPMDELAHGLCVDRTRQGVNVNQETVV
jgi:recombinational DNA repair protein (RecF pathway)